MQLRADSLRQHLRGELKPYYLVSGDEPLLVQEAREAIFAAAKEQGYTERTRLVIEPRYDWQGLANASAPSLFASQRVLDVRLDGHKPGRDGGQAIKAMCEAPDPSRLVVFSTHRLDKSQQQAVWFKSLATAGATLAIWPPDHAQLPGWIAQRARTLQLDLDPNAAHFLAAQTEGNLLAANNALHMLALSYPHDSVALQQVRDIVAQSSRFDVFELLDEWHRNQPIRVLKILRQLRAEGLAVPQVLWAVGREIRLLFSLKSALSRGDSPEPIFRANRVWQQRKNLLNQSLRRLSFEQLRKGLIDLARLDAMAKGRAAGDPWLALEQLMLGLVKA